DGCAIAWLTVDAGDNDLDRFITGLGQAFAKMNEMSFAASDIIVTRALPRLRDAGSFEPAHAIASTPLPFMLILDECEHLHNPAVLSVIQQLVDMLGPQQKIVIGSREQPM